MTNGRHGGVAQQSGCKHKVLLRSLVEPPVYGRHRNMCWRAGQGTRACSDSRYASRPSIEGLAYLGLQIQKFSHVNRPPFDHLLRAVVTDAVDKDGPWLVAPRELNQTKRREVVLDTQRLREVDCGVYQQCYCARRLGTSCT